MKAFKLLINLVFIGILIIACNNGSGGGNGNGNGKITSLGKSNLGGAQAAFITGKNASGKAARSAVDEYEEINMYKVGINGATQTVEFTDDAGNIIPAVTEFIQSLSKKYAVMRVRDEIQGQTCVFIIRKSDGKLYTSDETLDNDYTSYDDPLGIFTWDGFEDTGIDYTLVTKPDAEGNIYFLRAGDYTTNFLGTLWKIHESGGNTTVTTIAHVGEYYKFNRDGHIYNGFSSWLTPEGETFSVEYITNSAIDIDRDTGKLFALSSSPESFFTIDQVYNTSPHTWQKSVLSEHKVEDNKIVRTEHDVFDGKRIDENSVVTSLGGLGVALVGNGVGGATGEICYIKSKSEILYSSTGDTAIYFDLQNNSLSSEHYVYCFDNNDKSASYNTILRFDPQEGKHNLSYYSVPSEYALKWVYATFSDVLTAEVGNTSGQDVFIEIDASGKATIHSEHNGEKVLFRSAF